MALHFMFTHMENVLRRAATQSYCSIQNDHLKIIFLV